VPDKYSINYTYIKRNIGVIVDVSKVIKKPFGVTKINSPSTTQNGEGVILQAGGIDIFARVINAQR